jgi:AraC-like DNA-binding protein
MKYILKEITPLSNKELFHANYYPDNLIDFPLHFHKDFEINLTSNIHGMRIMGNHVDDFIEHDMVLISPNTLHCYKRSQSVPPDVKCEVTVIQFRSDLHEGDIFSTNSLLPIRRMLETVGSGIVFSRETALKLRKRIVRLPSVEGFPAVSLFMEILHELAISPDQRIISVVPATEISQAVLFQSRRINKIIDFVEANYQDRITLEDLSRLVGMPATSVSRFFRTKTKQRFWDYLNAYRVERAAQMMVETQCSISEICYKCGFNNISNFNRVFLKHIGMTPSQHRNRFTTSMIPNEKGTRILDRRNS